ncbi:MAG: histone [Candidatus Helarchaeales archaeon]
MAKKRFFAWSPLRSLMADAGAKIVSRDAVDYLISWLQDKATEITKRAYILAKHSNRKKITKGDIDLAIKGF